MKPVFRFSLILGLTFSSMGLFSCEKTKYRAGNAPEAGTPQPVQQPPAKSPDESGKPRTGGEATTVPANPYNPQPPPSSTIPNYGQVPPKPGTVVQLPGLGGKPVVTVPPKWDPAPPPSTSVPPNKVVLQLRVVQLNYEAWWKNCLTVSVAGDSKPVGCNKTTPLNSTVELFADKGICNRLSVRVQTYFPKPGACSPGFSCDGPYNETVDIDRSAGEIASMPFFKAYDRNNILSRDPVIAITDSTSEIKAQMDSFANGVLNNRWVRVYFEDQKKENLDAAASNPALRVDRGIDFNDYVFDIRGQGVQFYIDGLEPAGCTRQ